MLYFIPFKLGSESKGKIIYSILDLTKFVKIIRNDHTLNILNFTNSLNCWGRIFFQKLVERTKKSCGNNFTLINIVSDTALKRMPKIGQISLRYHLNCIIRHQFLFRFLRGKEVLFLSRPGGSSQLKQALSVLNTHAGNVLFWRARRKQNSEGFCALVLQMVVVDWKNGSVSWN